MLTCVPLLLHVSSEVTATTISLTQLSQREEGRGETDDGGCHGNWESVAGRHHLLLLNAAQAHEYFSFMDMGRWMTQTALWTSTTATSDRKYREVTKGGEEGRQGRDGWKGRVTEGDWQTSILSRAESASLSGLAKERWRNGCRDNHIKEWKKLTDFDHFCVLTEMQRRWWEAENKEKDGGQAGDVPWEQ